MSATPASILPDRQRRLLAFMGIDVYVRRGAASPPEESASAAQPLHAEVRPAPAAAPYAPAQPAPRLLVRVDGNAQALLARHRRLVDHVVASLGIERTCVRIDQGKAASATVPLLCLGTTAGDHPRAILGPPLAALAASGAAKAGLWRELRRLRVELERA